MSADRKQLLDIWLIEQQTLALLDDFVVPDKHRSAKAFPQSRLMLRLLLAQYRQQPLATINLLEGDKGKPYLQASPEPLHFNVSHSGDYWACAVSRSGAVGLDIEKLRSTSPAARLARRFFSDKEQRCIEQAASPVHKFFELWTQKEARAKWLGCSIFQVLSNTQADEDESDCYIQALHLVDGYKAALATADRHVDYLVHRLDAAALLDWIQSHLQMHEPPPTIGE
ncbi:MAG: 4'-phosphopantetheinyl transferase superfamily protein [gamma proteobacterium symbiont of Bathyaustriella thionipta]|nr:4'-phosphopantetheinyl transferase superfamily protein [gamma proteobacterium symbiont of Bathyaustriella thionipta]